VDGTSRGLRIAGGLGHSAHSWHVGYPKASDFTSLSLTALIYRTGNLVSLCGASKR
jgi:hypothetical protein